jgi:Transmembrane domain of unknown function (DUF3566)
MQPEGPRPARAWDDVVAPPSTAPAAQNGAAGSHLAPGTMPLTAAAAPVSSPPQSAPAAPNGRPAPPPPPVGPPPPPIGPPTGPVVAWPTPAPTQVPPPPPGTITGPYGPERTNGHLRAAPLPSVDPDARPEDTQPLPKRPEHARTANRGWAARRRGRKMRARKVRRQIRHVDPWSVLKFSLLFYLVLFLVILTAVVLLWNAAASTGLVDNIESFVEELFGFETFQFEPSQMLRASALVGLVMVVAGTAMNVLMAVLFNLISDLVGGIRVTVIEEETRRPVV